VNTKHVAACRHCAGPTERAWPEGVWGAGRSNMYCKAPSLCNQKQLPCARLTPA
jgi:hypothetical protein